MNMDVAARPPMGWNSWDVYGASVTEEEVLANAEAMGAALRSYGWEYVVIDGGWYDPGAYSSFVRPFAHLSMDEFGRLLPASNRFPSAAGGDGFGPLAERVHGIGLKVGLHLMRGVPRQAVHAGSPIKGSTRTTADIAAPESICPWNSDMYGVRSSAAGAQAYYDSVFDLLAGWGIDLVKVDDILAPYATGEIELVRRAIDRCGRPMVLSLSCGPTEFDRLEHIRSHAEMWRISADFWDRWEDLEAMFQLAARWAPAGGDGRWPDLDMLPLGHLALRSNEHGLGDRRTRFTADEQRTLMTLWSIARSPLMLGGLLTDLDEETRSLLTNAEVLAVHADGLRPHELYRDGQHVAWCSDDPSGDVNVALFNLGAQVSDVEISWRGLGRADPQSARDLWAREELGAADRSMEFRLPAHGSSLLRISGAT